MQTLSATLARSSLFNLIKEALKKNRLFRINHREGDVILMPEEEYEGLMETLELLSTPNFKKKYKKSRKEIKQKKTVSFDEVFNSK